MSKESHSSIEPEKTDGFSLSPHRYPLPAIHCAAGERRQWTVMSRATLGLKWAADCVLPKAASKVSGMSSDSTLQSSIIRRLELSSHPRVKEHRG